MNDTNRTKGYTSRDIEQFEHLALACSLAGVAASQGRVNTAYPEFDERHFGQLASFERRRGPPSSEPASETRASAAYTDDDLRAFARLTPGEPEATQDETDTARKHMPGSTDTDVGYIKIIEFDAHHAHGKSHRHLAGGSMKIRFFD